MSDVLKAEKITFAEGVFMIVGTNIGAGILSVSYAARKAGYLPLLFWLVVVGIITTITIPVCIQVLTYWVWWAQQLWAISFSWCGNIRSEPPP